MLIVKIGGSLFDLPNLAARIERLAVQVGEPILLVPGGGRIVDELRRLDAIHRWGDQNAHQLGLHAMSLAARMLQACSNDWPLVGSLSPSLSSPTADISVLDVLFVEEIRQLPATWDVTSDSLAAWIAIHHSEGRLLLAKSVDLPSTDESLIELAKTGLIDRYFPKLTNQLKEVRWINLRGNQGDRPLQLRWNKAQ